MTAPKIFTATAGHGDSVYAGDPVTLSWSGATGSITDFEIQKKDGSSAWTTIATLRNLSASGSGEFTEIYYPAGSGNTLQYRIRSLSGSSESAWKSSNLLTIAGVIHIKVNGQWKTGKIWIKSGGVWKQAKTVWIKKNNQWVSSK